VAVPPTSFLCQDSTNAEFAPWHLGAPPDLVAKVPTAVLENLVPLRPDEDAYGVTYDQIDDFLEGREIDEAARARILQTHSSTAHKRGLPVTPMASRSSEQ
jgi:NAD+ synthase